MATSLTNCVICYSKVEVCSVKKDGEEISGNLLKAQLNIIFILRDIFQVNQNQLEKYLKKWGNPEDWVQLCERCEEDVCNIRKIFIRLHEVKRELEKAKCVIQDRVQVSKEEENLTKQSGKERILHECRSTLSRQGRKSESKNYAPKDGDQRAKELASRIEAKIQNLVKEEVEENELEEVDSFDIDHWNSDSFHLERSPQSSISSAANEEKDLKSEPETCNDFGVISVAETCSGRKRRSLKRINYSEGGDDDSDIETKTRTKFVRTKSAVLELPKRCSDVSSSLSSDECNSTSIQETCSGRKRRSLKRLRDDDSGTKNKSRTKAEMLKLPKLKAPGASTPNNSPSPKVVRCPVCKARFSVGPVLPFSEHFQVCVATLSKPTSLKCSRCKTKRGSSKNVREFLEHVVLCVEGHNSKPVPWRHALIKCNLCKDSCYIPYLEFVSHVYNRHQHRYGCSQCSYRCHRSADISGKHWERHHKNLLDVPVNSRYERLPEGTKLPLPCIPWWCPASDCFQEFSDEASRDQHVMECQVFVGQLPERSAKCSFCNRMYFYDEELLMHRTSVHGYLFLSNPHKCEECDIIFQTARQLLTHRRREHRVKLFRCETCGAEFSRGEDMWSHVRLQHGSVEKLEEFTCKICQKVFGQKCYLRNHMEAVHHVKCAECGMEFDDAKSLISHMSSEHQREAETAFPCTNEGCVESFRSYSLLQKHIRQYHFDSAFKCSFCGKKFRRHSFLRMHTKSCRLPILRCTKCKLRFATEEILTEHKRQCRSKRIRRKSIKRKSTFDLTKVTISEDNASVTCNICQKKFTSLETARKHVRGTHENKYAVICSECGISLKRKNSLKLHMLSVHGISEGHKCETCGKTYLTETGLTKHRREHSLESSDQNRASGNPGKSFKSPFICDTCGKSFKSRSYFKVHLSTIHAIGEGEGHKCEVCGKIYASERKLKKHKKEEHNLNCTTPHICDTCGKTFTESGNLQKHIRNIHENYRPEKCDLCGMDFPNKVYLSQHKLKVHGEGDYKCEVEGCSKVFCQKKDFEQHKMYKHEGVSKPKRYSCQFCGKAFAHKQKVKDHEEAMHTNKDIKPFKCTVPGCEKTFATIHYLKYHLKHTHKMKKTDENGSTDRLIK